eukprot:CAMPEP_0194078984 /NCGR_PEP_ID=MMETSP0149-20130528/5256_1 /TAXON_ID=122233 /ORGANISM="Chaetoceros debilis, Strain MM31A-1" /LENGTH=400 /DNA_ID=CAMNT_0038760343 /DNA_START=155 /DNA_END=1357 /DNA_ORIENTATION=-
MAVLVVSIFVTAEANHSWGVIPLTSISRKPSLHDSARGTWYSIDSIIEKSSLKKSFHKINKTNAVFGVRGGSVDDSEYDDSDTEDEYDSDEYDSDEYDSEDSSSEEEEDEYDSESEEEKGTSAGSNALAKNIKSKATSNADDNEGYDKPLSLAPLQDMGITLGVMFACNKFDLTNTNIIKVGRFAFIAYVVIAQLFLIYVRYKAKSNSDTTEITVDNPISNLLQNQLSSSASGGGGDMVKNIANSMLSSSSTVMDYDLKTAKSMGNGMLFPMGMLWFLHFKMGQVQPLFYQTTNGIKELVFSPLFQIYILGRNLERPFKNKKAEDMQKMVGGGDTDENEEKEEEPTAAEESEDEDSTDESKDEDESEETDADETDESEDEDSDYSSDDDYDEYDESDEDE